MNSALLFMTGSSIQDICMIYAVLEELDFHLIKTKGMCKKLGVYYIIQ